MPSSTPRPNRSFPEQPGRRGHAITNALQSIRRLIPSSGGLDISPMIALLLLDLLRRLIICLLL